VGVEPPAVSPLSEDAGFPEGGWPREGSPIGIRRSGHRAGSSTSVRGQWVRASRVVRVSASSRRCWFPSARVALVSAFVRRRGFPPGRCTGFRRCPKAPVSVRAGCSGFRQLPKVLVSASAGCRDFRLCPKTRVSVLAGCTGVRCHPRTAVCSCAVPARPPVSEDSGLFAGVACLLRDDVAAEAAAPFGQGTEVRCPVGSADHWRRQAGPINHPPFLRPRPAGRIPDERIQSVIFPSEDGKLQRSRHRSAGCAARARRRALVSERY
jgi:hypothetical protein